MKLDVTVVVVGHPPEGRERLTLGAGRDHHYPFVGEILDLAGLYQHAVGRVGHAQIGGDVEVLAHRTADQGDLAAEPCGSVDYLLDPVDVRGERGNDDPAFAAGERVVEGRADARLGR